jgi:hypothetical protein
VRKKWELGAQLKGKLREDAIADASFLRKGPGRGSAALAAGSGAYLKRQPIRTDGIAARDPKSIYANTTQELPTKFNRSALPGICPFCASH